MKQPVVDSRGLKYAPLARLSVLAVLSFLAPVDIAAQNSVYGVLGVGFPGRPIGVRARALGGSGAPFDARSALNPASVAGFRRLSVTASSGTTLRSYTALDSTVDGLSETRFPFAMLAGWIRGTPISFALSYSTYAERTFDVTAAGIVTLRGEPIVVVDRVVSDGGVADIRGALAWQLSSKLALGGAVHVIGGSATLSTSRLFGDARFSPLLETDQLGFSGFGVSGGLLATPHPRFAVAAAVRMDTELEVSRDREPAGSVELPLGLVGGVLVAPARAVRWSTTFAWQSWSDASDDLAAVGSGRGFDSWEVGTGVQMGGSDIGGSSIPLRVGVRYARLPFSPTADQPWELGFSGGTALVFANGRGILEVALERIRRDGGGAKERVWQLSFSITVQP